MIWCLAWPMAVGNIRRCVCKGIANFNYSGASEKLYVLSIIENMFAIWRIASFALTRHAADLVPLAHGSTVWNGNGCRCNSATPGLKCFCAAGVLNSLCYELWGQGACRTARFTSFQSTSSCVSTHKCTNVFVSTRTIGQSGRRISVKAFDFLSPVNLFR